MKAYNSLLKGLILSATLAAAPALFAADSYTQVTEIFPSDPAAGQFYGLAVAISDDVAVVGAPSNFSPLQPPPPTDGAAYVYVKTNGGWTFQQKLVASDGNARNTGSGNMFGLAVAMAGDTIIVGAPSRRSDGKTGAVYVFKRSDTETVWTEQAIITSSTPRPFGLCVALRGQSLVAGGLEDRLSQGGTSDAGLAFVFVRSGEDWIEQGNLMSSEVPIHNRFGVSVDIRGNTVVVGAQPFVSAPAAVYVFSRQGTTWTEDTKLTAENNSGSFGQSVSLWGASLAVGDPGSSTVSIYEHSGHDWQLMQTLAGGSDIAFGYAVAQREDKLLIGARRGIVDGVRSGAAYLDGFDESTWNWTLNQTLVPADGQETDNFGGAVSLGGTTAIIGAFRPPNPRSGAAYIYEP